MSHKRCTRVALLALGRKLRLHIPLGVQAAHERDDRDRDAEYRRNDHDHHQSQDQECRPLQEREETFDHLIVDWSYVSLEAQPLTTLK